MALRLATARRKPPPAKPKKVAAAPAQEPATEAEAAPKKNVKYDPHTGGIVEVDPDRPRKTYPSAESSARVAKCVICLSVKDKTVMACLGQNHDEKGTTRYVWRCKTITDKKGSVRIRGCEAGTESWLKHYKDKSPFGKLWNFDIVANKPIKVSAEEEKAVGKRIVEARKAEIEADIVKALSKRKKERVEKNRQKFGEKFGKAKAKTKVETKKGDDGSKLRRKEVVPRWKRKGRSARVSRR